MWKALYPSFLPLITLCTYIRYHKYLHTYPLPHPMDLIVCIAGGGHWWLWRMFTKSFTDISCSLIPNLEMEQFSLEHNCHGISNSSRVPLSSAIDDCITLFTSSLIHMIAITIKYRHQLLLHTCMYSVLFTDEQ